jgi:outer membrane protein assembly factor BamB
MKKIFILLVLMTSSCSSTDGFLPGFVPDFISNYFKTEIKPYADLPEFVSSVDVVLRWEKKLQGKIDDTYSFLNLYKYNENLYVPTNEKKIHIIASESGEIKKSIDVSLDIFSNIIVDSSLVYFGTLQDTVTALNISNNEVLWQRIMPSEVMSISEVSNNTIFIRTNDSKITAIDINTGEFLWINSQIPTELSIRGLSKPRIDEEKLFVGFEDGKIVSYNIVNGDINWQAQIPSGSTETIIDRLNDIDGNMIVDDGALYAISYQGNIVSIDTYSGQILWKREASSLFGLESDGENVFYIDDEGILWCIEKYAGRPVWKQDKFFKRLVGQPIFYNNFIIVNDIENYIHIIDSTSGSILGRIKFKKEIQSMYVDYDSLYLLDKNFSLKKYEINKILLEN